MIIQQSSFIPLLGLVFLFVVSVEVSAIRLDKGKNLVGYTPIKDLTDPHVQEVRKFTVDEHNKKAQTGLKLDHLVSGESEVVAGIMYKLVVSATDGYGSTKNYEAGLGEGMVEIQKSSIV